MMHCCCVIGHLFMCLCCPFCQGTGAWPSTLCAGVAGALLELFTARQLAVKVGSLGLKDQWCVQSKLASYPSLL
jgi:hypothetical protein